MVDVLGGAYSRQARKVFAAAHLRRHTGLGPLGGGGIYMLDADKDASQQVQSEIEFLDLDNIGIATSDEQSPYTDSRDPQNQNHALPSDVIGSNTDRGLPDDLGTPNADSAAYGQIGKLSLGDIDISEDGQYLFVINYFDRKLYKIDLTNPKQPVKPTIDKVRGFSIPGDLCSAPKAGEYRPDGLKIYKNMAYVGVTCSGQKADGNITAGNNSDMKGAVYSFDLADETTWTKEAEWTFDYRDSDGSNKPWFQWSNTFEANQAPIIGDIEFDNGGNMIIGIRDITGDKFGLHNYSVAGGGNYTYASWGDVIRAEKVVNSGVCSYNFDLAQEYYNDDILEPESFIGTLAVHHTSDADRLIATYKDPDESYQMGVMRYDNATGEPDANKRPEYVIAYGTDALNNLGKANGIGDLEILEELPPIEIGNLVWEDKDNDGIQDADEAGIQDVKVQLLDATGTVIANTITDSNGNYIFNHTNVGSGAGLQADINYTVRIDPSQFTNSAGVAGTPLETFTLSNPDVSGNSNTPDKTDSDAKVQAGEAVIPLTTQGAGQNNHSYDFGFRTASASVGLGCTTINNTVSITAVDQSDTDASNDTATASIDVNCVTPKADLELVKMANKTEVLKGDTLVYTLTLTNKGSSDATNVEVADTLPSTVTFVTATAPTGTSFNDVTKVWTIPLLPAAAGSNVVALQIEVTVN